MTTRDTVVVLTPYPMQFSGRSHRPGFTAALDKVRAVWEALGFQPWREEIWYRVCSPAEFGAATDALRERLMG